MREPRSLRELQPWLNGLAQGATPDFDECLEKLGTYFPLLYRLADTRQDPVWSAEGNVAIHTGRVLEALYAELDQPVELTQSIEPAQQGQRQTPLSLQSGRGRSLTGERRQALILSALLHDIAKPLTTRSKTVHGVERMVATGHEGKGASYLVPRLMMLGLSYPVITLILGLVGFHQMPKWLVMKAQGIGGYLELALNADLELMYWLAIADLKGRKCDDLELQLDLLAQFRLSAKKYRLWAVNDPRTAILQAVQVKSSPREQAYVDGYTICHMVRGKVVRPEEALVKIGANASLYTHVYVMCGMSGSGKSTWIKQYLPDYQIISLDEIRAEVHGDRTCQKNPERIVHIAKARLKTALANRHHVVWDATNLRVDYRQSIVSLSQTYKALITLVVFHLDEKTLKANDRNRQYTVGEAVIEQQLANLQWPSVTEGHRMIVVGEKGETLAQFGSFIDQNSWA